MASTDTAVDSNDDFQPPCPKERKRPKGGLSALKSEWMSTKRRSVIRTLKLTLVGLSITSMLGSMTITHAFQRNLALMICCCLIVLAMQQVSLKSMSCPLGNRLENHTHQKQEPYPPKTVYLLLCGLHHYMEEEKVCAMNIFERDDPDFKYLY